MKHVAVIGSGISGLATAYLLSQRHRVTLIERAARLGGHTNTVTVDSDRGPLALDTGFLVHNEQTYPNLIRLFAELGVETRESDMSFSVSCPTSGFEYSSRGLRGFFAQPRNLTRPAHFRLLADILRFNRHAPAVLTNDESAAWTVGDLLRHHQYSDEFVVRYLTPMASAIWSCSLDGIHRFPARTLVTFLRNHGMLSVGTHVAWRVVRGGSHQYVPRLTKPVAEVRMSSHLRSIGRDDRGVTLSFTDRPAERVDEVVIATHGDQVLALLADASPDERDVFRHFSTTTNETWLHTDGRVLPTTSGARASWNYRLGGDADAAPTLTYDLNRLQGIAGGTPYCVTLNPREPIAADRVLGRFSYRHPRYTLDAVRAQDRWRAVSGARRTHFCGAYWGYGFHEDGLVSAIRVARDFGVSW